MTRSVPVATVEHTLHAALELSKNNWLLAIQFPGRDNPSLHAIKGGDAEGLMAKLDEARDRVAKVTGQTPRMTLCYEAGYDGFWLARFLEQRGIECLVMEPASLQVNRRARRVKTDRIDVENLLHTVIAWCRGERHVCSMVVIPSVDEEDLRRSHRERARLVGERTAHINRIKGLLFGQGIRGINVTSRYKTLAPADLVTGDGRPLPERLGREITRGDRETDPGASADRRGRVRARSGVDVLCHHRAQASRPVTSEGHWPDILRHSRPGSLLPAVNGGAK